MSDILERLQGYNPPDRTVDEQRQIAIDIQDAAAEITRLKEENDKLRELKDIKNEQLVEIVSENNRLKEELAGCKE